MVIKQSGSAARNGVITVLIVCVLLVFAAMMLPKGFSSDISMIGKGKPVIVLMHDKNSVKSQQLMELLNKLRPDYAGRLEFLAVDIDSQEGQAFSRQQNVGGTKLILFDAAGTRLNVYDEFVAEQALRSGLDSL